jgi:hypothetical protein
MASVSVGVSFFSVIHWPKKNRTIDSSGTQWEVHEKQKSKFSHEGRRLKRACPAQIIKPTPL